VLAAAIDHTGRLLATAGADGIAGSWDITDPAAPTPATHSPKTPESCTRWPSARTGDCWPLVTATRQHGCGTSTTQAHPSSCPPCAVTLAGSSA